MAGQESTLPCPQVLVEFVAQLGNFAAKAFKIVGRIIRPLQPAQILDFAFELFELLVPSSFPHLD
jgi:hypothetical protein